MGVLSAEVARLRLITASEIFIILQMMRKVSPHIERPIKRIRVLKAPLVHSYPNSP